MLASYLRSYLGELGSLFLFKSFKGVHGCEYGIFYLGLFNYTSLSFCYRSAALYPKCSLKTLDTIGNCQRPITYHMDTLIVCSFLQLATPQKAGQNSTFKRPLSHSENCVVVQSLFLVLQLFLWWVLNQARATGLCLTECTLFTTNLHRKQKT